MVIVIIIISNQVITATVGIHHWPSLHRKPRTTNIRKVTIITMLILSCQAEQVRWSSAPTATTTPTSTLAHGSTAPMPIWGRTTRWTRLYRAWRKASMSTPSTTIRHWRASSATRTPPSFSPHTRKGWAATLPRSTMLMVRLGVWNSIFFFYLLEQDGDTILSLGANYLNFHHSAATEKKRILYIFSSPSAVKSKWSVLTTLYTV